MTTFRSKAEEQRYARLPLLSGLREFIAELEAAAGAWQVASALRGNCRRCYFSYGLLPQKFGEEPWGPISSVILTCWRTTWCSRCLAVG